MAKITTRRPLTAKLAHPMLRNLWVKSAFIAAIYLAVQFSVLGLNPAGWSKFWGLQPPDVFQYWDTGIYAQLALSPACTAFYPLWPRLIQWLSAPASLAQAVRFSTLFSEVIFLGSLPIALFTIEKILTHKKMAFLAVFLYALGPNAIFHSIGYTESVFGLLSLIFLLLIHTIETQKFRSNIEAFGVCSLLLSTTIFLSLARPVLMQSGFALLFSLVVIVTVRVGFLNNTSPALPITQAIPPKIMALAGVIATGSVVGYSLYGFYCWQTTGDFLAPFHAQVEWGRTVGFRPWLLLFPRTLLIDLYGLYTPALVVTVLMWMLWQSRRAQRPTLALPKYRWLYGFLIHPLAFTGLVLWLHHVAKRSMRLIQLPDTSQWIPYLGRFSILFAISFSGVHSLINFLANTGNLYSTSRHFFGTPFAFIGIGAILTALSLPQLTRLTWVFALAGVGLLLEQWMSYASGGWLG